MSEAQKKAPVEFKTSGTLTDNGVVIAEQSSIDQLTSRGYGTLEGKTFTLAFFEALYLQDKAMLEAKTKTGARGLRTAVDEARVDAELPLRAYPRRERLLRVVRAHDTTPFSGSQVSRAKGEGIEFADIRPFTPGDRVRRVNWRASARRERMYVNESHPERASDVILFLDSFAEARGSSEGTIDQAVRAASSLADAYLERRNRVGLVSFGGILRWLHPGWACASTTASSTRSSRPSWRARISRRRSR